MKLLMFLIPHYGVIGLNFTEIRAVPLINPGRGGFEELKVHFLMEKEQQQKERLLKDYLLLIEIPIIGLGYDATRIVNAARYLFKLIKWKSRSNRLVSDVIAVC